MDHHEVPTALNARPMFVLRQIPGMAIRVPSRAATIVGVGLMLAGMLVGLMQLPLILAPVVLGPAIVLAVLVEVRPGGKPPAHWVYVRLRRRAQAPTLRLLPLHGDDAVAVARVLRPRGRS